MKPQPMPLEILKVKGIMMIVRKTGNAVLASSQRMDRTPEISRKPTRIRAGAVA